MDNCDDNKSVLDVCMGRSQKLVSLVEYAADSIVSKTILDKPVGTITLFAFDKGQKLSEHTVPYNAVVQVLDGAGMITIDGKSINVSAGQIIVMPGNIRHSVKANERFKMLLTMIRA